MEERELPTIHIGWDAETQTIRPAFDTAEFKTWSFVKAVLAMAQDYADRMDRMQQVAQLKQAQAEHKATQRIVNGLSLGKA